MSDKDIYDDDRLSSDSEESVDLETSVNYALSWFDQQRKTTGERRTGLVYDKRMRLHHSLKDHPERPERIDAIYACLEKTGLLKRMHRIPVKDATFEDLRLVHAENHIALINALVSPAVRIERQFHMEFNSVFASEGSPVAAYVAAGGVISAVEAVTSGAVRNAICVVRPPGHHAEHNKMCGFCLFNNVAVAAAAATNRMNVRRVLILDWDVHHGNGIQHAFDATDSVLYISIHRWDHGDFYPGGDDGGPGKVGVGRGEGYNINIAWNGRSSFGDEDYLAAFDTVVMPAARAYDPELVIVSAGFDAAIGDPLGGCSVTPNAYAQMLYMLSSLARGRVVVALEGGYNLSAISASMLCCANVLLGEMMAFAPKRGFVQDDAKRSILATIEAHSELSNSFSQRWTALHRSGPSIVAPRRSSMVMEEEESEDEDEVEVNERDANGNEREDNITYDQVVVGDDTPLHVVNNVQTPPMEEDGRPSYDSTCEACGEDFRSDDETWVCLKCYSVFCSNSTQQGHVRAHAISTGHRIAMRLADFGVYDFELKRHLNAITDPDLRPIVNVFHRDRFGQDLPEVGSSYAE